MTHGVAETVHVDILAVGEALELRHQANLLADALDTNNLPLACEAAGNMLGIPPRLELFNRNNGLPKDTIADHFIYELSPSYPEFAKEGAEEFAFSRRPRQSPGTTADTYEEYMKSLANDAVNARFNPSGASYARDLAVQFADDKRLHQTREGVKRVGLMEFVSDDRLRLHTPYGDYDQGRGYVSGLVASVSFDRSQRNEVQAYFEARGFTVDPKEPPVIAKLRRVYTDDRLSGGESLKEHLGFTDEQMATTATDTIILPVARITAEATIVTPVLRAEKSDTRIMPAPKHSPTRRLALGSLVTAEATPESAASADRLADESVEVQLAKLGLGENTPPPSRMERVQTLREALTLGERRLQLLFTPAEMTAVEQYLEAQERGIDMPVKGLGRIAEAALKMAYDHVDTTEHADASKRLAALDALKHLRKG